MGKVINSYKGNAFTMSSAIVIDPSLFLPKIDNYSDKRRANVKKQRELSRLTLVYAQEYLDLCANEDVSATHSTQRSARKQMAVYVKSKLDLKNPDRSYFVPSFVWQWLAGKVVAYVIKLIIEHYWPDLVKEWHIDI